MTNPRTDPEYCAGMAYKITVGLKVKVSRVSRIIGEESSQPASSVSPILLYVKSLNSSIDELPVIAAMLKATSGWPGGLELYEYESLGGEGDRYAKFARLLGEAIRRGRPFLALVPQLMTVRLLEGLNQDMAEVLEASAVASVEVEKEDILYLPRYVKGDGIELVVKESSASSPERAEFLKRRASELGVEVSRVKRLPDNSSILNYVLEKGVCSALERVPVTRLARMIYAAFQCTGLSGLAEGILTGEGASDRSILTIYSYALPSQVIERLLDMLSGLSSLGWIKVERLLDGVAEPLREPLVAALKRDINKLLKHWWCP